MSKEKITRVKYFTPDKEKYIYEENWKKYKKYLQSNIIKNKDVKDTTYKRYGALFRHFLIWLGENYGELFAALHTAGYNGRMSIEGKTENIEQDGAAALAYLKQLEAQNNG